ncbi:amidase signature enzyme [Aspergillus alliaceus]|uniref:amidase signature enzyme n=1 Tax=Petromyces alliaceus TaxID=209559 RepID=UPI0012A758B8|nr:amidase signature enzyme [Aspergillus alliaceus]KAB8233020.1 amidase signature enzyme [Aspergillus alliaceus]
MLWNIASTFIALGKVTSARLPQPFHQSFASIDSQEIIFELHNNTVYLSNVQHPKAVYYGSWGPSERPLWTPLTAVSVNTSKVTEDDIKRTIQDYIDQDDVFNLAFLEAVLLQTATEGVIEKQAIDYLRSLNVSTIFVPPKVTIPSGASIGTVTIVPESQNQHVEGPFVAALKENAFYLYPVWRLYSDLYSVFLQGSYDPGDGSGIYRAVGAQNTKFFEQPLIPVPSRIYSWRDPRPLAGARVGVKDLFDVKGLQTTGGSKAWTHITPFANVTAPAIQRIIDLGGHIVGKQKLAQFASAADPWLWQDEHYPFNPRGDGWLTCSASSSGGGCSIAAYEWLDFAIGTDTGSSMRLPAAVSGTAPQPRYDVARSSHPSDTTGVFTRDPKKWAHFSKAWYTTTMQQNSTLTGLPAYDVPNTNQFPKRLVYLSEFSPQNQAATEPIWQSFISNLTQLFNMTTETINFTAVAQSAPEPAVPIMLEDKTMITIWTWDQWRIIGKPLINAWTRLSDGRFPPLDPTHRDQWQRFLTDPVKEEDFQEALESRAKAVTWFEESVLFSTNESCSESLLVYDIGPGGFPSYREDVLNKLPNTTYVYKKADDAAILGASICPIFGCADYTIPIGEVPYKSAVTLKTEMMPVSMNLVVKRGCDFVLFNMIERLADAGLLRTVKAGRTLF